MTVLTTQNIYQHLDRMAEEAQESYEGNKKTGEMGAHSTSYRCSDPRVILTAILGIKTGDRHRIRGNIGGVFNPRKSKKTRRRLRRRIGYSNKKGDHKHRVSHVVLCVEHHSGTDVHRCCAGHNYDCNASFEAQEDLRGQVIEIFGGYPMEGEDYPLVYAVVLRIDTDADAVTFYGEDPSDIHNRAETLTFSIAEFIDEFFDEDEGEGVINWKAISNSVRRRRFAREVDKLYGHFRHDAKSFMQRRMECNFRHVRTIMQEGRPEKQSFNQASCLLVGTGEPFPDRELVLEVTDSEDEVEEYSAKGLGVIAKNKRENRVTVERGALMVCVPYDTAPDNPVITDGEKEDAFESAENLARMLASLVMRAYPELKDFFVPFVTIMDRATLELTHLKTVEQQFWQLAA